MRRTSKYFILFFAAIFPFCGVFARNTVERVYLSTDKDCYVSGDYLCCSAFCFDVSRKPAKLSELSSIVYVELVSAAGVAQTAKIALVEGRGSGIIKLSPDLPTGNYRLLAYTRWNRNEKNFVPEGKLISIFNTISSERVPGNVFLPAATPADDSHSGGLPATSVSAVGAIDIAVDTLLHSIVISNKGTCGADLSVSVYHDDDIAALPQHNMLSFRREVDKMAAVEMEKSYLPEYEGEIIEFSTNVPGKELILSFPGKDVNLFSSKADSAGKVSFYTGNVYGDRDAVVEILDDTVSVLKAEIADPFIRNHTYDFPPLSIDESLRDRLLLRGMGMQVSRRFGGDTLFEKLSHRPGTFLGEPDKFYRSDDYTKFSTMREVLVEYVTEIKPRTTGGKADIQVLVEDSFRFPRYSSLSSLVLLDGVPVLDYSKLLEYDPMLVSMIKVYTGSYLLTDRWYEGVACFNTYKGNLPSFRFGSSAGIVRYKGALYPQSFTGKKTDDIFRFPDLRQTIYWHPSVSVVSGDAVTVEYVKPLYGGTFRVVVEGVSSDGEVIYCESSFRAR